jgi:hypothetical protein
VRDADDCAFDEFLSDDPLDGCIRLGIHGSGCLVHEEDPAAFQHNPAEAEELLLPYAPVLPHVGDCKEQAMNENMSFVCYQLPLGKNLKSQVFPVGP